MIIIVAAYSPVEYSDLPSLGAARKIESVISVLHRIDSNILLVNSAHNKCKNSSYIKRKIIINNLEIDEIILPTRKNKKIGKFINTTHVFSLTKLLLKLEKPGLIWIYNGYLFESLFTIFASKFFNCPFVLEFEDWHFSRNRFFSIKTLLDFLTNYLSLKKFALCFAVNNFLLSKVENKVPVAYLLPGIVSNKMISTKRKIPFSDADITVGYFGGLDLEKGFDVVLGLVEMQLPGFKFIVCGAGDIDMESRCQNLASLYPLNFIFCGRVENEELYRRIGSCDLILNPHKSIEKMKDGIFPFKVIEAIGSGRLIISTPLPILEGYQEVMRGVYFVKDASPHSFASALLLSRNFYEHNKSLIINSSRMALSEFGERALFTKIYDSIGA